MVEVLASQLNASRAGAKGAVTCALKLDAGNMSPRGAYNVLRRNAEHADALGRWLEALAEGLTMRAGQMTTDADASEYEQAALECHHTAGMAYKVGRNIRALRDTRRKKAAIRRAMEISQDSWTLHGALTELRASNLVELDNGL